MADNSRSFVNLKEAMEKLWFRHNILFSQPTEISISTQISSYKKVSDGKEEIRRKPERLNIPINRTLYQLQLPARLKGADSGGGGRRRAKTRKRRWSLSELESFQLEGIKDLGFEFRKEELSPAMAMAVPGPGRLEEEDERVEEGEAGRPWLSEAWLVDGSESLLRLPRSHDREDMKKHLRFWAHTVASSIHLET